MKRHLILTDYYGDEDFDDDNDNFVYHDDF